MLYLQRMALKVYSLTIVPTGFSFLQYNLLILNSGVSFSSSHLLQLVMCLFHFVLRSFVSGRVAPKISDSSFSGIVCICACLCFSEQQHFVAVGAEGKSKMAAMSCSSAL